MLETLSAHLDAMAALAPVWGYAFIFAFMAIESSFIPFPSEVVMLPAGFLAARGELTLGRLGMMGGAWGDFALAITVGTLGSLAGAYFNYFLSARVGEPFLRKYGKWFFVKPSHLDRASELFNRYGAVTTFVCRLLPVIRQLISIPAGLAKMPLKPFTFFTTLGAGLWNVILVAIGFWFGLRFRDMAYSQLVVEGKALISEHYIWLMAALAVFIGGYMALARLAMGRGEGNGNA